MTEQEPKPTSDTPAADAPKMLKLTRFGREVEKPVEEVVSMAQKAWDYSEKTTALAKEREQLKQEATIGREFLALRESDPERARQIAAIVRGESLAPQPHSNGSRATLDDEALTDAERRLLEEVQALRQDNATLKGEVARFGSRVETHEKSVRSREIDSEIDKHASQVPHWVESDLKLFKPVIANFMRDNPGTSAYEAVTAVAEADAQRERDRQQALLDRKKRDEALRTESPRAGALRVSVDKPATKADLLNGSLLGKMMAAVNAHTGDLRGLLPTSQRK